MRKNNNTTKATSASLKLLTASIAASALISCGGGGGYGGGGYAPALGDTIGSSWGQMMQNTGATQAAMPPQPGTFGNPIRVQVVPNYY
jgi:hypothetical protein